VLGVGTYFFAHSISKYHAAMLSNHTGPIYDSLFLMDFVARYAVDRCEAPDTIFMGVLSVFCVLPLFAWVIVQISTFLRPDLLVFMHSAGLTMLTLAQIVALYTFSIGPPIKHCGPSHAWPCPQVTITAFFVTCYLCYCKDFSDGHSMSNGTNIAIFQWLCVAVLHIGFASPEATLAGSLIGTCTGCTLYKYLLYLANYNEPQQQLLMRIFKKINGRPLKADLSLLVLDQPSHEQGEHKETSNTVTLLL